VGPRVLGSAIGMDKDVAKRLVRAEGIAVVPYVCLRGPEYEIDSVQWIARIERELGYPAFVKPATLGSSVGVSKASNRAELTAAIALAFSYDDKLLVEKAVRAREIEFAVLAARELSAPPEVSVAGEITPIDEFYSFERKYLDAQGAALTIPAAIDDATRERGQRAARQIFLALELESMARVDFFLDKDSGELYFNEVNTIPGFTSISMYPKLWAASGVPYAELLDRLLQNAVNRHERRSRLSRER
jgi:D-alanine-D-alanine ligase